MGLQRRTNQIKGLHKREYNKRMEQRSLPKDNEMIVWMVPFKSYKSEILEI